MTVKSNKEYCVKHSIPLDEIVGQTHKLFVFTLSDDIIQVVITLKPDWFVLVFGSL